MNGKISVSTLPFLFSFIFRENENSLSLNSKKRGRDRRRRDRNIFSSKVRNSRGDDGMSEQKKMILKSFRTSCVANSREH